MMSDVVRLQQSHVVFTIVLQIFGVVSFSVVSVVNRSTEIKKTQRKIHTCRAIVTAASADTEI